MRDAIRQMPLFANFTDEQCTSLWDQGSEIYLEAGETLFHEGDPPQGLYILLEGSMEISKKIGAQPVVLAIFGPGQFVGEISLLTGSPHNATVRLTEPSRLLKFDAELFNGLKSSPVIGLMLSTMAERLRNTEAQVQQHEKLSALGKMSAGLAHELNNPASASLRAAKQLPETLSTLQALMLSLNQLNLRVDQVQYLIELQASLMQRSSETLVLDSLEISDREEEVAAWIEDQGIPDGWQLAPVLVGAALDIDQLDTLRERVGDSALGAALIWLEGTLRVLGLLRMIETSTTRIVELIKSVKAYSYMDQGPSQEVDIHEGLENTLTILNHKLKNVTVTREYDHNLPHITVYGSELNQVWTNLIDNAIAAMDGRGHIWIRTWRDEDRLKVEIKDNGPGIPSEIQSHIFEPFFTTKPVGEGTGLGLDISYRIVVDHHQGSIKVDSAPGDTRFQVCLPVGQANENQND
jgi:signal transduction histidine kinase